MLFLVETDDGHLGVQICKKLKLASCKDHCDTKVDMIVLRFLSFTFAIFSNGRHLYRSLFKFEATLCKHSFDTDWVKIH